MEFIVSIHMNYSEKHKNKIPLTLSLLQLSTKPNGKPATKRKHQCSGKSTSNKAATATKTIGFGKALNGNLLDNQAPCEKSLLLSFSLLRRMLQLTTQQLCQGKTQTLSCWTSTLQLARQEVGQKMLQMKRCWTLWTPKNQLIL